eukprot:CAMPEP_0170065592 /NCGR_PEP_ID=MMETSP0019_2-20121128/5619_1 /TAXON_ID=98059 /ORGANISM="Dinobryon sp., Strain UTEXLB2267" /LENGTH=393 /DNA_ID=CAMNT_0010272495 /DNA_START=150 /DNA_END=1331 /DNA_ORIENTATION=+
MSVWKSLATLLLLRLIDFSVISLKNTEEAVSITKFDHFVKVPYYNLHSGGRLTERQIGYIASAGYSSILSIVDFSSNDTSYNGVNGSFPSSAYEVEIANDIYGINAKYLTSSLSTESLNEIVYAIDTLSKPLFVHCHVGYSATLFVELYLYTKKLIRSSDEIYINGLNLGYDYRANADVVAFINSVTDSQDEVHSEIIEQTLANGETSYKSFYWSHRTGESDFWYNIGQILDTQLASIGLNGYKSIISFRDNGEATNRLPSDLSSGPVANNEFSNDVNGSYSVSAEQAGVLAAGMAFFHLPLTSGGTTTWTEEQFYQYLPVLKKAEALGPVLAHCASGYRSAAYVLAYLAIQNSRCTDWALQQSALIGVVYNSSTQSSTDKQVVAFFQQVLKC